jgi:hypothetical protein
VHAPASSHPLEIDESLIDWFLSLTPTERLAELESRLDFFQSVRPDGNAELPADHRAA